jgi:hypothetical protein
MKNLFEQYIQLIRQLSKERFFGKLILQFESGMIVLARKEETIKLKDKS